MCTETNTSALSFNAAMPIGRGDFRMEESVEFARAIVFELVVFWTTNGESACCCCEVE